LRPEFQLVEERTSGEDLITLSWVGVS
jgi:hypothetical protein